MKSKRVAALLLAGLLSLPPGIGAAAAMPVQDAKGHWAENTLSKWVNNGWLKGQPDGSISPNKLITRAEVAALVNAAFGFTEKGNDVYRDVKSGQWFASAVAIAAKAGYMKGGSDGRFRPNDAMTRQEIAVLIANLLQLKHVDPPVALKDAANAPTWSKGAIGAVVDGGIMVGQTSGSFGLLAKTTRAETVVILERALTKRTSSVPETVYGQAGTFDAASKIDGSVRITSTDVVLKNADVAGDLIIDRAVGEGDVTLDGVTVKGKLIINGGGANSIHLHDTEASAAVVDKEGSPVRIVADGVQLAGELRLQSPAIIEQTGSEIPNAVIAPDGQESGEFTLSGTFDRVQVSGSNAGVSLLKGSVTAFEVGKGSVNTKLQLAAGTKIGELRLNGPTAVKGQGEIGKAIVSAFGSTLEQEPGRIELSAGTSVTVGGKPVTESTPAGGATSGGAPGGGVPGGGGGLPGGGGSSGGGTTSGPADALFDTSRTVRGGTTVALKSAPAYGTAVWLAPADTKAFAEGSKMTRLKGNGIAKKLAAPAEPGDYRLYLVTGSTASAPSAAVLKVENTANVSGTVKLKDGTAFAISDLVIEGIDGNGASQTYKTGVDGGRFNLYLPDGGYRATKLMERAGAKTETGLYYSFDVREGKLVGGESLSFTAYVTADFTASGTVQFADGEAVPNGTLMISDKNNDATYRALVKDGKFGLYLPHGEYEVNTYHDEAKRIHRNLHQVFAVAPNESQPLALTVEKSNFTGTLKDAKNQPVASGTVTISSQTIDYYAGFVVNGSFSLYLPDGSYEASHYDNGRTAFPIHANFSIQDGKLVEGSSDFSLIPENLRAVVTHGGRPAEDGYVNIVTQGYSANSEVVDGRLSEPLPEGSYTIESYTNGHGYFALNVPVEIGAEVKTIELTIPDANLKGTVSDANGDPEYANVGFTNVNAPGRIHSVPVLEGQFEASLPDGTYAFGYNSSVIDNPMPLGRITIAGGKADQAQLTLTVPRQNVNGTITDEDGKTLPYVRTLRIQSAGGGAETIRNVTVQNGKFRLYLPDGQYEIVSYSAGGYYDIPVNLPLSVNGSASPVVKITGSVKGMLRDAATDQAISGVDLVIEPASGASVKQFIPVWEGRFSANLPDGRYQVKGYETWRTGEFSTLGIMFTVAGGQVVGGALDVLIQPSNVIGRIESPGSLNLERSLMRVISITTAMSYDVQIRNSAFSTYLPDGDYTARFLTGADDLIGLSLEFSVKNGTPSDNPLIFHIPAAQTGIVQSADGQEVSGGMIGITSISADPNRAVSHMYEVAQDGKFTFRLPAGSYKITNFSYGQLKWISVNVPFTIPATGSVSPTLVVKVPSPNVRGTFTIGGDPVENALIEVYVSNMVIQSKLSVRNGQIQGDLPDGLYQLDRYVDTRTGEGGLLNTSFTIQGGVMNPAQLTIALPLDNVKGTVKDDTGQPVSGGRVFVKKETGTWVDLEADVPVMDGAFSLSLPDGNYVLTHYRQDNSTTTLNVAITVKDGTAAPIALVVKAPNVFGLVDHIDGTPVADGIVTLMKKDDHTLLQLQIANGIYKGWLPDGEYAIMNVILTSTGKVIPVLRTLTVSQGKVTDDNVLAIRIAYAGQLAVQWSDGSPANEIRIALEGSGLANHSYLFTPENGNITLQLTNGQYRIAGYFESDYVTYHRLPQPLTFQATGGKLDPADFTIVLPKI
ncbi:S-layer homology domain-containing protein [Paenibacillus aurantiacus]|uniref:S-layer homology domain-containing protein n=1 Tax=Paenibacillus aurantiacus TaxID=1936118 RepID=A0ABV5KMD2_9BACL